MPQHSRRKADCVATFLWDMPMVTYAQQGITASRSWTAFPARFWAISMDLTTIDVPTSQQTWTG